MLLIPLFKFFKFDNLTIKYLPFSPHSTLKQPYTHHHLNVLVTLCMTQKTSLDMYGLTRM